MGPVLGPEMMLGKELMSPGVSLNQGMAVGRQLMFPLLGEMILQNLSESRAGLGSSLTVVIPSLINFIGFPNSYFSRIHSHCVP